MFVHVAELTIKLTLTFDFDLNKIFYLFDCKCSLNYDFYLTVHIQNLVYPFKGDLYLVYFISKHIPA